MTEAEAWDSLAEHLKQKNYTGVLVLADWFQENGKEEVAVYLRWANKRGHLLQWDEESECWHFLSVDQRISGVLNHENVARLIVDLSGDLQQEREWYND